LSFTITDSDGARDGTQTANGGTVSPASGAMSCGGTPRTCTADVTYTTAADFFGTDSFSYKVDDGEGGEDTAEVQITVTEVKPDTAEPTITDLRPRPGDTVSKNGRDVRPSSPTIARISLRRT
jgi:hypothetical protein